MAYEPKHVACFILSCILCMTDLRKYICKMFWFDRLAKLTSHGHKDSTVYRTGQYAVVDTFICFGLFLQEHLVSVCTTFGSLSTLLTIVFCVCYRTDVLHRKSCISNACPCRSSLRTDARQPEGFWVSTNCVLSPALIFHWIADSAGDNGTQWLWPHLAADTPSSTVFGDIFYWKWMVSFI
jgi:hypothetical protein